MTPEKLKKMFPMASASTLARNDETRGRLTDSSFGDRGPDAAGIDTIFAEKVTYPDLKPSESTDESKLNKTERAYLAHLRMLNVPLLNIQAITLKLADDCRLTVDFTYVDENGRLTFVDVKGFQREDALIKIRVAARKFPEFKFVIIKRDGTGWSEEDVKP